MAKVVADMSMSLDGFIADRNDGVEDLFEWYAHGEVAKQSANEDVTWRTSEASAERLEEAVQQIGALVTGRRLFDMTDGWGGRHPMGVPVFVVTHEAPTDWAYPDAPFTFVTDGVQSAVEAAKRAAGDKTVAIASASITQQCLALGLVDEISANVVPVLLGEGVRWFDNLSSTPIRLGDPTVVEGTRVTHMTYPVIRRETTKVER